MPNICSIVESTQLGKKLLSALIERNLVLLGFILFDILKFALVARGVTAFAHLMKRVILFRIEGLQGTWLSLKDLPYQSFVV